MEASPELRKLQAANLKTTSPTRISSLKDLEEQQSQDHINHDPHDADQQLQIVREDGIPITWHQDILDVPTGIQSIFLAHEFFDALPVFKFQYTEVGWREILIDIAEDHVGASSDTSSTPFHFRYVLAPAPTRATIAFIDSNPKFNSEAMKVVGNRVEISPDSQHIVKEVANRIRKDGGMGLVVDYGKDELIKDSLRVNNEEGGGGEEEGSPYTSEPPNLFS